jgi:uncharacterized protein YaiL (DUF2058 family)
MLNRLKPQKKKKKDSIDMIIEQKKITKVNSEISNFNSVLNNRIKPNRLNNM